MVARFTPDYNEQNPIRYLCEASLTLSPPLKARTSWEDWG